uniref:Kinesin-like protein KIF6/9 C-terminal domain-containing protein n=1 Tax=Salarias fasciatus TaxID=181472 RepID=A0A672HJN1_SALFA
MYDEEPTALICPAFEIFVRNREDHLTVEDNLTLLKQRLVVTSLQLWQTIIINPTSSAVCSTGKCGVYFWLSHIAYSTFGRLKALRTEIEHLQLLLERAKVKLHKDFLKWWDQQASHLQRRASQAVRRSTSLSPTPLLQSFLLFLPFLHLCSDRSPSLANNLQLPPCLFPWSKQQLPAVTECPALDAAATTPSSIPLTGDQQVDADILAFVRARQNLLTLIHLYCSVPFPQNSFTKR